MNGKITSIEVEATITFNRREIQLIHHITRYDNTAFFKSIETRSYSGGVTKEDLIELFKKLGETTGKLITHAEAGKSLLFENP